MDSSLNHFRASQGRRNQRKEKQNRKYNPKDSAAIRAAYKSQLKQTDFSEEARLELRKRLINEQKQKRRRNLIILSFTAICIAIAFIWVLLYL
ncbi:hypothetical protein [Owenweeksia hongkongensis]|uniref:hypothetical protein n=1 Tax=Owenweeksia hongkongensis TaxID=253245 RepID=UPI003A908400